ncbi:MAG: hypothetical protein HQL68_05925 [Magnetococcales bacterium]|nr:hypothetical protein [Magnetococcales bacterium]
MRNLFGVIAILSLLLLIVEALHLGVADLHRVGAVLRIESWIKTAKVPTHDEWLKSHKSLQTAIKGDPDNPQNMQEIARLLTFNTTKPINEKVESYKKSLEYLRPMIQLQPASAYLWARLARAKFGAKQFDEQTWQAMNRAIKAAPNDYPIQLTISKLSLLTWPWIPNRWRDTMQKNIQRTLNGEVRGDLIQFAKRNNKLKLANHLCRKCDVL